tara:strand:- start:319 stop:1800 length:1482 start_codon:yes stop_codon:yes gene_type:complete
MVLSVLDGSTLRTPHNIYVLDGSTVRRVRQIRALDGSNIRHPFTKTDFFDFSGTANTLNPAVSEVYQYTIGNATNSGTQTVYTGYQQSNTGTRSATNTYSWTNSGNNPGSSTFGNSFNRGNLNGGQTFQHRILSGTMYVPNATPSNTATFRMDATFRHYRTNTVPTGQQLGNSGLFTGANLQQNTNCNWFTAPTTYSTNPYTFQGQTGSSGVCNGSYLYDWRNYGYTLSGYYPATLTGSHGTITLPSAINYAGAGFQWYAAIHATAFNAYGVTSGGNSTFTATVTGREYYTYYTNHVSSSSSTVNLGATFSFSGAGFSGSGSFSTSNTASTHAETLRSSIAGQLPSGWSATRSNNTVTVTAPASSGNVNDMSVGISNGSGVNQGTNPSPGQTFTVRPASNVSGSGSTTTQGQGQTGNLTSATVTSGGNSTSINLSNGASTDTAGSEIASAMNGLADTTATYDSGTNRMTVVAPGDTSVSLSNANTLSISKVSL